MFTHCFLKNFCKRNRFSFRAMRKKKRSEIDPKEVDEFVQKMTTVFQNYQKNRIANMDETPWNFVYNRGQVLADTGIEEVKAVLPDDYRKSFTVIATITADGNKLPPIFLAQGTTNKCHKQFSGIDANDSEYDIFHSQGGNTDEETMKFYLNKLSNWMGHQKCALILDRYASHTTEETLNEAERLGIELVFIPTSATDKYQPLDKIVFGVLKSQAASAFDDKAFEEDSAFTKPEAATLFIHLWRRLGQRICELAWTDEAIHVDPLNEEDAEYSDYESEYDSYLGDCDDRKKRDSNRIFKRRCRSYHSSSSSDEEMDHKKRKKVQVHYY